MKHLIDTLGGATYPKLLKYIPNDIGIGGFAKEFKDAKTTFDVYRRQLENGRDFIRMQLIWSHNNHSYGDSDIPALEKLGAMYDGLAASHPGQEVYLSFFCEHKLKNPDKYGDILAAAAPHCIIVNTPSGEGSFSKKYLNEVHGKSPSNPQGAESYSTDGDDAFEMNIEGIRTFLSDAEFIGIWTPNFNLHATETDKNRNTPPTEHTMKSAVALCRPKGATSLPHDALWKPISEKGKPVFITPVKASEVVLKKNGKVIERMPWFGYYIDGRSRYYSKHHGYELGLVDIFINGKKYGTVNGSFRENSYR